MYYHYTDKKIETLYDVEQNDEALTLKPKGLWLSRGTDWYDWCIENSFSTCRLDNCYIYEVDIDKKDIITISSITDLDKFNNEYSKKIGSFYRIDWKKVSEKYDGISFENYKETKEKVSVHEYMKNLWYLGIDVNSVCLWRPSKNIKEWKKVKTN